MARSSLESDIYSRSNSYITNALILNAQVAIHAIGWAALDKS